MITKNCRRWKSTSGWDGKRLFAHNMRTNRRILEIQTAYVQVLSKWWWKNVVAKNLLPVWMGKGFLLISWELIDRFSKFKRHMFRFDRSDDLIFFILKIYFRFEQKNWKLALKQYFWKKFRSGLNGKLLVLYKTAYVVGCGYSCTAIFSKTKQS